MFYSRAFLAIVMSLCAQPAFCQSTPTEAYLELHKKELAAKSYADIIPLRARASLDNDNMSKEDQEKFFPLFKQLLVRDVKVLKETLDGDKAILEVTAPPDKTLKPGDTETTVGTIELLREDGTWKLSREKWSSKTEIH